MKLIVNVNFPPVPTRVVSAPPMAQVISVVLAGPPGPPGPTGQPAPSDVDFVLLFENALL